jgi:hypothetical protein
MKNPHCYSLSERQQPMSFHGMPCAATTIAIFCLATCVAFSVIADQTIELKGDAGGKRFDGIGAVSGGGATSVLFKDYPEPQRSQVWICCFKPKFGASMSALLVEVPGDANATQGRAQPHAWPGRFELRSRLRVVADARGQGAESQTELDACAWGCPGWVGNGNFWSQDMCDYYVSWIQGSQERFMDWTWMPSVAGMRRA